MDTTAAAELGAGAVGPGVDGVGFWDWGSAEQEAWMPEDEQQQQQQQVHDTGTRGGDESGSWGKGMDRKYHGRRPPPSSQQPFHKRMRTTTTGDASEEHLGGQNFLVHSETGGYEAAPGFNGFSTAVYTGPDFHGLGFQGSLENRRFDSGIGDGLQSHGNIVGDFNSGLASVAPPTSAGPGAFAGKGKGTGSIFFKTKLCIKFKTGTCPYNSNCTFAHGMEELRRPPPDWKDVVAGQETERGSRNREGQGQPSFMNQGPGGSSDAQRFHKTRPCKRYYSEEGCPYGDRCIFLHDDQGSQPRAARESNAISLGPTSGGGNGGVGTGGNGAANWKNRICNKWETTGHCPFGQKCHFAHGFSDSHFSGANPRHGGGAMSSQYQKQVASFESKWKGPTNEISTIYGDWIEDDEWENVTSSIRQATNQIASSMVDTNLLDGRKDDKAGQGQQSKLQISKQPNVTFFRGNGGHDGSGKREGGQNLHAETMRGGQILGSYKEHGFHGDGDLDAEDGWSGEL